LSVQGAHESDAPAAGLEAIDPPPNSSMTEDMATLVRASVFGAQVHGIARGFPLACGARGGRALVASLAPAYSPRRPQETVLYDLVRSNLETFLAHASANYEGGLPRYVEQELRGYLACGDFSLGTA
jgi:hypothetical protein